jgi:hypothetical protein
VTAPAERPWERHEWVNQARWTVVVSYTVAGGARRGTAADRAARLAARLASAVARMAGVVEVTAVAGEASASEPWRPLAPERVTFDGANSDRLGSGGFARWVDAEHERTRLALAAHERAYVARRNADNRRRVAVGCRNASPWSFEPSRSCDCVYCFPAQHVGSLARPYPDRSPHPIDRPRCVCGHEPTGGSPNRCVRHAFVEVVVLDGDADGLREYARLDPVTAEAAARRQRDGRAPSRDPRAGRSW